MYTNCQVYNITLINISVTSNLILIFINYYYSKVNDKLLSIYIRSFSKGINIHLINTL